MSAPVGTETAGPTLRVAVIDYGAGNLHSLIKALERPHTVVQVATDPLAAVQSSDALVLPGVGAFAPAAARLAPAREAMRAAALGGMPLLGICLGMQLLFDGSEEGPGAGLGLFGGEVTRLTAQRVPQIGWNRLDEVTDPLLRDAGVHDAYYANSFACRPDAAAVADVVAWSTHDGDRFPAAIRRGLTMGMQFHPEKSSAPGVRVLHAFCDAARARLLQPERFR